MPTKILVAGDVTLDCFLATRAREKDASESDSTHGHAIVRRGEQLGGAVLLGRMIEAAVKKSDGEVSYCPEPKSDEPSNVVERIGDDAAKAFKKTCHEFHYRVAPFKDKNSGRDFYRVAEYLGCVEPVDPPTKPNGVPDIDSDILLFNDAEHDASEREGKDIHDSVSDRKSRGLVNWEGEPNRRVIYIMNRCLIPHGARLEEVQTKLSWELAIVTNMEFFRRHKVSVSRQLSWERTAADFVYELQHRPELQDLRRCEWLFVRIGLEGAILYESNQPGTEEPRVTLFFNPKHFEDGYQQSEGGKMVGLDHAFAAGLVKGRLLGKDIYQCVRLGLAAATKLWELGFDVGTEIDWQIQRVFDHLDAICDNQQKDRYRQVNVSWTKKQDGEEGDDRWSIVGELIKDGCGSFEGS